MVSAAQSAQLDCWQFPATYQETYDLIDEIADEKYDFFEQNITPLPVSPSGMSTFSSCDVTLTCSDVIGFGYGLDSDVNSDCHVNLLDLALIAMDWMWCIEPTDSGCDKPWE